jgi:hypothetical protein
MTLDQHRDFEDLVKISSEQIGILPALVLKDYWVTRILRSIASDAKLRQQVIFKGGTSLSKGWRLIDRFSEDIDLLTTGPDFSAPPSITQREKLFKAIRKAVERDTPLRLPELNRLPLEQQRFLYQRFENHCNIRYPLPNRKIHSQSATADYVFIEMGFRGGPHPHLNVSLNSFVGDAILLMNADDRSKLAPYKADFTPFHLELLDPVRTFIEKLLAIHCAVVKDVNRAQTRHYYDLTTLFNKHEPIRPFLASGGCPELIRQVASVTIEYFDPALDPNIDLSSSPAFNLSSEQAKVLASQYAREREFYFKEPPTFEQILDTVNEIRRALQSATP